MSDLTEDNMPAYNRFGVPSDPVALAAFINARRYVAWDRSYFPLSSFSFNNHFSLLDCTCNCVHPDLRCLAELCESNLPCMEKLIPTHTTRCQPCVEYYRRPLYPDDNIEDCMSSLLPIFSMFMSFRRCSGLGTSASYRLALRCQHEQIIVRHSSPKSSSL